MTPEAESAVDELYAGDPAEFVAGRDRLARELNKAGDKDSAREVKQLRRPSVAAAALNALARTDPAGVQELLDLGAQLGAAQQAAVTGGGASALRDLTAARRRLVARLTSTAARGLTPAARDAVSATLEAATVDPDVGRLLQRGRLTTEASSAGFGLDLFALAETTEPRKPASKAAAKSVRTRLTVAPEPDGAPAAKPRSDTPPRRGSKAAAATPKDVPPARAGARERAASQAADDAQKKRAAADADEQAVLGAKAEVAACERALKEARKALAEAQRRAQRSELAAATAEHKAWELGERTRED